MDETQQKHPFSLSQLQEALVSIHSAGYSVFGPMLCNHYTSEAGLTDGSCEGVTIETKAHDFRFFRSEQDGSITTTYLHVNLVLTHGPGSIDDNGA